MTNLVNVKVHGILAEQLGREEWNLSVNSVSDAVRGIEANCKNFYKRLWENDRKNIKYRVLINKKDFNIEKGKDPNTLEGIYSSELVMKKSNIKTIDIVPIIEGEDMMSIVTIVVGVALIASGIGAAGGFSAFMAGKGGMMAAAKVIGGLGLVAAGVTNLLTPMPKFGDFGEIQQGGSKSYLFNGPENTIREGGPVFVAYGRLIVGSHVIQSSLDTIDVDADVSPKESWGDPAHGLKYSFQPPVNIPTNSNEWNGE